MVSLLVLLTLPCIFIPTFALWYNLLLSTFMFVTALWLLWVIQCLYMLCFLPIFALIILCVSPCFIFVPVDEPGWILHHCYQFRRHGPGNSFDFCHVDSFPMNMDLPFLGLQNNSLYGMGKTIKKLMNEVKNHLLKWGETEAAIQYP